jgi:hypothetical protein
VTVAYSILLLLITVLVIGCESQPDVGDILATARTEKNAEIRAFWDQSEEQVKLVNSDRAAIREVKDLLDFFTSDFDGRSCSDVYSLYDWEASHSSFSPEHWYVAVRRSGSDSVWDYHLNTDTGRIDFSQFVGGCPFGITY